MVTLKYGSQGEDVKTLQTNLTNAGYDVGGVDGIYGTKTANAVKQYQQANGLTVDGIAGSNTLAKLSVSAASTPTATATATAKAPDYTTQNMKVRDDLYAQIMGRKPFSYDAASDPIYRQYKDLYTQQGQMAMEDTMGQAAALTGGYGNTYGQAVGQQQYNDYMSKLNGIIPDLENSAYSKWQAEGSDLLNRYNMADAQVQTEKADAQSQVSALISIGQMPDDRLIALSGYDKSYVQKMVQYAQEQAALAKSSGGSGGGRGSSSGGSNSASQRSVGYFTTASAGVNKAQYDGLVKTIRTYLSQGNSSKAYEVLQNNVDNLSDEQYENLKKNLGLK